MTGKIYIADAIFLCSWEELEMYYVYNLGHLAQ